MQNLMNSLYRLSDEELLTRLKELTRQEREATARVVAHLALVDARRLYLPEGCSSMFTYCTRVLHYSERAAYARIEVARAARRFPLILTRLAEGSLNLTTVRLIGPHLTGDNHREVIDEAAGGSRRQVEELVARLRPLPPVPASIRKLPAPEPAESLSFELATPAALPPETAAAGTSSPAPSRPSHRAVILPLAPEYYRLQVTLSAETHARLRQAQELMRHSIPTADPAKILDRALKDLVEKLSRRKFAALTRSRAVTRTMRGDQERDCGRERTFLESPRDVNREFP